MIGLPIDANQIPRQCRANFKVAFSVTFYALQKAKRSCNGSVSPMTHCAARSSAIFEKVMPLPQAPRIAKTLARPEFLQICRSIGTPLSHQYWLKSFLASLIPLWFFHQ